MFGFACRPFFCGFGLFSIELELLNHMQGPYSPTPANKKHRRQGTEGCLLLATVGHCQKLLFIVSNCHCQQTVVHYRKQLFTSGNSCSLSATVGHCRQQLFTIGNGCSLSATFFTSGNIFHFRQQSVTIGNSRSLSTTVVHCWQRSVIVSNGF